MFPCTFCGGVVIGRNCSRCGAEYSIQIISGPTKEVEYVRTGKETYDQKGNRVKL